MVNSMTAFAARTGQGSACSWTWDLRSLNSKGLDLRMRVPDWVEGLEPALRARISGAVARGSVAVGLRLVREDTESAMRVEPDTLDRVLDALAQVAQAAEAKGVQIAPASGAEILGVSGVVTREAAPSDTTALRGELLADFEGLLSEFLEMRAREGAALRQVLDRQLDQVADLVVQANAAIAPRADAMAAALRSAMQRVLDAAEGMDPDRIAQELALLAVKSDVTEELDRLVAHVDAARDLLATDGPVGRKLDFLTQEFNREANTLCSKSQDRELTRIGLDLKAVIDQMREQAQNVE